MPVVVGLNPGGLPAKDGAPEIDPDIALVLVVVIVIMKGVDVVILVIVVWIPLC